MLQQQQQQAAGQVDVSKLQWQQAVAGFGGSWQLKAAAATGSSMQWLQQAAGDLAY